MSEPAYAPVEHNELMALQRDAERYRWLRDGKCYTTDAEFPFGDELDKMCDLGVAGKYGIRQGAA